MKRSITATVLAALIAFLPFRVGSEETNSNPNITVPIARCIIAVVYTIAGGVVVYYVKQWCDKVFSNQNWQLTNEISNAIGPIYSGGFGGGTTTIQNSSGMGSCWVGDQSIDLQQTNGMLVAVLRSNGVYIATLSAPVHCDGETVTLDFRPVLGHATNADQAVRFFRLMN